METIDEMALRKDSQTLITGSIKLAYEARKKTDVNKTSTNQLHPNSDSSLLPVNFTTDEKFELLSAYLDNEVTKEEQALVDQWLTSDTEMQKIYQKQLRLKHAIREIFS